MTKVLWFSRHTMNADQVSSLERKLGEIQVTQINRTIDSAAELKDEVEGADIIAIIAPINLQQTVLEVGW